MKDNDAVLGGLLNNGLHAGEVRALGLRQKLRIGFYGDVDVGEDFDDGSPMSGRKSRQADLKDEVGTCRGKERPDGELLCPRLSEGSLPKIR